MKRDANPSGRRTIIINGYTRTATGLFQGFMVYNIPNWIIAITVVGTWLIITIPGMPPVFIAAMIVFAAFIIWYAFTQLYFSASYNNVLNIYLTNNLEGGGDMYTQDVLNFVARNVGKVDSVFEYCAGPGFMGFFLLAHDMCRTLSLADISPQAVKAMNMTVEENKLQDRVRVYQSDCLEAISADERWDFVVANPPWWLTNKKVARWSRILCDPDGRVHREFFENVGKHLKPGGSILLVEGGRYTQPDDFREMIETNGFEIAYSGKIASNKTLFKDMGENAGLRRKIYIALMRRGIMARKSYFIWIKRRESEKSR